MEGVVVSGQHKLCWMVHVFCRVYCRGVVARAQHLQVLCWLCPCNHRQALWLMIRRLLRQEDLVRLRIPRWRAFMCDHRIFNDQGWRRTRRHGILVLTRVVGVYLGRAIVIIDFASNERL